MKKFVVGIVAVLCLHIGFVLYVGGDRARNVANLGARDEVEDASPIFIYPPRSVSNTSAKIFMARGGEPESEFDGTAVTPTVDPDTGFDAKRIRRPNTVEVVARRNSERSPRSTKTVRRSRDTSETIYQNASYTVTRAELRPAKASVAAPILMEDRSSLMASSKKDKRGEKRSLLSKMSPIVKKPYDLLKAVGSWVR